MGIQQPAALCVLVCEWGGVSGHKRGQMGAVRLLMYFFPFHCFIIHTYTKGVSPQKTILLVGYLYEFIFYISYYLLTFRKKKVAYKITTTDDKRLQNILKRIRVNIIPQIEEVNIFFFF
ncbi:hypothetical protein HanPI659440_Chr13g0505671 [Helianthus annuus]|nr:hypothetical protein HanPI659440_Chr13g0505671 [Helianthus annuus]